MSHSDGVALYAVARGREIGIDLERTVPDPTHQMIAARFFSPREVEELRSRWNIDGGRAFFAYWTRKEAYAKATGESLMSSNERRSEISSAHAAAADAAQWVVRDLYAGPGFAAALVTEGRVSRLHAWEWPRT